MRRRDDRTAIEAGQGSPGLYSYSTAAPAQHNDNWTAQAQNQQSAAVGRESQRRGPRRMSRRSPSSRSLCLSLSLSLFLLLPFFFCLCCLGLPSPRPRSPIQFNSALSLSQSGPALHHFSDFNPRPDMGGPRPIEITGRFVSLYLRSCVGAKLQQAKR